MHITTFSDFQPSKIDRFRWRQKGYKVFCSDCWWIGKGEDYDYCPDCRGESLEWIIEKPDSEYAMIEAFLKAGIIRP